MATPPQAAVEQAAQALSRMMSSPPQAPTSAGGTRPGNAPQNITITVAEYGDLVAKRAQLDKALEAADVWKGEQPVGKFSHKLLAKPTKFTGLTKNANAVHDYLHAVRAYLRMSPVDPAQSLCALKPGAPMPWDDFEQGLVATFGNVNQSVVARVRLSQLKQTGRIEPYYKRFITLCAEITELPPSEGDTVFRFMQGLKPEFQRQLAIDPSTHRQYDSFLDLTNAALALGSVQGVSDRSGDLRD